MLENGKQKGFSLIETVVVLAIFVIIMGAIVYSVKFFYKSNTHALEQSYAITSARKGVESMVRSAREAAYSDEGAYPVISMATSSFSFYSDIDSDIFIEKIRYFLDGTDLNRGVIDSSGDPLTYDDLNEEISTVSDDVRNIDESVVLFTYYDESGSEITNTASTTDVRYVVVDVVIDVNLLRLPDIFTLRSSATLRNVKEDQ
ncbi:PilW family protein [candidate division KSB1 bacterium]